MFLKGSYLSRRYIGLLHRDQQVRHSLLQSHIEASNVSPTTAYWSIDGIQKESYKGRSSTSNVAVASPNKMTLQTITSYVFLRYHLC